MAGRPNPDVGRRSSVEFLTGEQISAAVSIGAPLSVDTTITLLEQFPSIEITSDSAGPIQVGELAFFTVAVDGGTPPYRLRMDGPSVSPLGTNAAGPGLTAVAAVLPDEQPHTITATVEDAAGLTISDNLTVQGSFGGPQVLTLNGPTEKIMAGEPAIFVSTTTGGRPGPIFWNLPAGAIVTDEELRDSDGDGTASITFELALTETSQVCVSAHDGNDATAGPVCTTVEVLAISNITGLGSPSASTTFANDPSFIPARAVDNSLSTSWFSSGPGSGGTAVFTWTATSDVHVTEVEFTGNAAHSVPAFRSGFGFASVQVLLLDVGNNVIATRTGSGFGDSFVFDDTARSVQLVFSGHQDPNCGGFGELDISGYATE